MTTKRFFTLFSALSICATGLLAENLLSPDCATFETDVLPAEIICAWNKDAVCLTDQESYRGEKSLELTYGPTQLYGVYFPAPGAPFKAGETYTCSLYLKAEKACAPQLWAYATQEDSFDNLAWSKLSTVSAQPGTWQQMKVTATMSEDTPCLYCYIAVYGGYEGKIWIDEVKIEPGNQATGEAPGRIAPAQSLFPQEIFPVETLSPQSLDDSDWQNVPAREFAFFHEDNLAGTTLRYTSDLDNLYFLFEVDCPGLAAHRTKSELNKVDWDDERVELHISPALSPSVANFYFTANVDGTWYSSCKEFNGDMVQASRTADSAKVYFRIPKNLFGASGDEGQVWSFNASRFHRAGASGASALFPYKESFTDGMKAMLFAEPDGIPPAGLVEYGALREYAGEIGGNVMVFEFAGDVPSDLSLVINRNPAVYPKLKGKKAEFIYDIIDGKPVDYTLLSGENTILAGELVPGKFLTSGLDYVTPVSDPVCEELFGEPRQNHRMMLLWVFPNTRKDFSCALKSAVPYSYTKYYQDMYDSGMSMLSNDVAHALPKMDLKKIYTEGLYIPSGEPTADMLSEMVKNGTARPFTISSNTIITGQDENGNLGLSQHKGGLRGYMIDPINADAYLEFNERYVDVYGDYMEAFFPADELIAFDNYLYSIGFHEEHNLNNPTGAVQKIEAEILEKYGHGKYGCYYGMDAANPDYPWCYLATMKCVNEKLTQLMERTRQAVKERQPDMPFLSDDAYQPALHMVCNWGRYADIGTYQIGEGDKNFGETFSWQMYRTKLIKDLSRVKEMLVVPHAPVDGFPLGALSEAGRRESYSALIRGGATGLNIFAACLCGGGQTPLQPDSINLGFPESWHHLVEFAKMWQQMPDLKFPDANETGVLFSEASEIICNNSKRHEFAFNLLGAVPEGWMTFLSETLVERGELNLNDYKRLFIPYAPVSSLETIAACSAYVENGGLLVICDPLFANTDNWNESLAAQRRLLLGCEPTAAKTGTITFNGRTFAAPAGSMAIDQLPANAKVLATYDDGKPAAYELARGKGRLIFFAFPVMVLELAKDQEFTAAFLDWEMQENMQHDEPIWHFTIPEIPPMVSHSAGDGICLTGNLAVWKMGHFYEARLNNVTVPYQVSVDGEPNTVLTDRLDNFAKQDSFRDYNPEPWILRFTPGQHTVTVKFTEPQTADSLTLYVNGTVPELTLNADGSQLGTTDAFTAGENNLVRYDIAFPEQAVTELQLSFEQAEDTELCFAELEVWHNRRKCDESLEIHNAELR